MSELYHYGIKGQKWGVRRYQNEDGTLTAEGKERLSKYSIFQWQQKRGEKKLIRNLAKTQNKAGRKFDKVTEKILKDQAAGKKVSDRRLRKAVELGTKFRVQDYNAQNFDKYLSYNNSIDLMATGAGALGYAGYQANNIRMSLKGKHTKFDNASKAILSFLPGVAALSAAKVMRSIDPYAKKGERIVNKAKKETIADLKAHGIIAPGTKFSDRKIRKMYQPKAMASEKSAKANVIFNTSITGLYLAGKAANSIIQYNKDKKASGVKSKSFYKKVYNVNDDIFKDIKMKDIGNDFNEEFEYKKRLTAG